MRYPTIFCLMLIFRYIYDIEKKTCSYFVLLNFYFIFFSVTALVQCCLNKPILSSFHCRFLFFLFSALLTTIFPQGYFLQEAILPIFFFFLIQVSSQVNMISFSIRTQSFICKYDTIDQRSKNSNNSLHVLSVHYLLWHPEKHFRL